MFASFFKVARAQLFLCFEIQKKAMNTLLNLKCFVIFAEDWHRLGNLRLRPVALCLRNLIMVRDYANLKKI